MKVLDEASRAASEGAVFPLDALGAHVTGSGAILLVFWKAQ